MPSILLGRPARDQALVLEGLQDAAEIARVEPECLAELRCDDPVPVRDFVDNAPLGQGEGAVEKPFVQYADPPRVEPREAPDGVDWLGGNLHSIPFGGGPRSVV